MKFSELRSHALSLRDMHHLMYLNGKPVAIEQLSNFALCNYGHFTSMRVEPGGVAGLQLHFDRLTQDSLKLFGFALDMDLVRSYIRTTIASEKPPFILRITAFPDQFDLQNPINIHNINILITTRPAIGVPLKPMRVKTVQYQRELPDVKHVAMLGALHARRLAQLEGFNDALFINNCYVNKPGGSHFHSSAGGHERVNNGSLISEGVTWNVGFYDGTQVIWPATPALPGVTQQLLEQSGIPFVKQNVSVEELPNMKAAFATNVSFGVRAISSIDDVQYGETEIITHLQSIYQQVPLSNY